MKELEDYFLLMKEKPEWFINNDESLIIIKDKQVIEKYMNEHHMKIGVIYQSSYHTFIVDLVKDKSNRYFTYERMMKEDNGVVVIPRYHNRFVLLKQYRHALRDYQIAFPRGFGEKNLSAKENAIKELKEELNANVNEIEELGSFVVDSGMCGNSVKVFLAHIDNYQLKKDYEEIQEVVLLTNLEMRHYIQIGKIDDCMTIASFQLLEY